MGRNETASFFQMRLPCPAEGLAGAPRLSSVTDPHSSPHDIVIIVSGADATLRCKNCGIP
jgi:hypothetical protein